MRGLSAGGEGIMIIDARVRPPFKSMTQVLASEPGARPPVKRSPLVSGYERTPSMTQKSWELFIEEMDGAGVNKGILVGRQAGHRIILNDDIAELRDRYPERFPVALAGINGADIEAGVIEIERTLEELHFSGIAIDPGWWFPPRYVDDPKNYPLYQRCAELGGVLYLTCSLMQGPDISYAEPYRIQRVANAFPTLQIVIVHGAFPYTSEMLGVMIANAPLANLWVIPDFFQFIPGFPGAQDWVDAANHYLGDRILYASSYPVRPLAQSLSEFQRFSYKPEVLENLLSRNAATLFDIG
ncbi:MAG: amidohydrolase family protein [Methanoregulaceae archaeon]|nr:amidohydrolase family protein [Methanoregulaceae archaeon]MCU0629452.1 amidohydrolase family protein [Methanoregulaceae archaeon]